MEEEGVTENVGAAAGRGLTKAEKNLRDYEDWQRQYDWMLTDAVGALEALKAEKSPYYEPVMKLLLHRDKTFMQAKEETIALRAYKYNARKAYRGLQRAYDTMTRALEQRENMLRKVNDYNQILCAELDHVREQLKMALEKQRKEEREGKEREGNSSRPYPTGFKAFWDRLWSIAAG